MKARYNGASFGVDGLSHGRVYEVIEVDVLSGALRVIDDSGEDYLYSPINPRPIADPKHPGGRWEVVEDDTQESLKAAIH